MFDIFLVVVPYCFIVDFLELRPLETEFICTNVLSKLTAPAPEDSRKKS